MAVQADEEVKQKFKDDVEKVAKECFELHPLTEGNNYIFTPNTLQCNKMSTNLNLQGLATAECLSPSSSAISKASILNRIDLT